MAVLEWFAIEAVGVEADGSRTEPVQYTTKPRMVVVSALRFALYAAFARTAPKIDNDLARNIVRLQGRGKLPD